MGLRIEPGELAPDHMDQGRMVTGLEIQLRLLVDAGVNDDVQPVARTHQGNRPTVAVAKDLGDLRLTSQVDVLTQFCLEIRQPEMVRGWQHSEPVAAAVLDEEVPLGGGQRQGLPGFGAGGAGVEVADPDPVINASGRSNSPAAMTIIRFSAWLVAGWVPRSMSARRAMWSR